MEDEHICQAQSLPGGNSLFAVFDGHGGKEVSRYVASKFVQVLINLKEYQD